MFEGVQWVGWSRNCSRKTLFTDRSLITSEISTSKHKAIRVPYSLQNGQLDIEKKNNVQASALHYALLLYKK